MNWLDQYVWGYMVYELRFVSASTEAGLRRVIRKIWDEKITKEFCQNSNRIKNYWKRGKVGCPWWKWNGKDPVTGEKTPCPCRAFGCSGHGVIEEVMKRKGDRISFANKADEE
eukprot:SAG22_NODE_1686_length_3810_cov_13.829695_4_plen_113_part_00